MSEVTNLCVNCFESTTGVAVAVGDCAMVFGRVMDIVAARACECPCHEGHACVMPRRPLAHTSLPALTETIT